MHSLKTISALAAFALIASITPGPNNLMLMASGTNFGLGKTWPHVLGVTIGFAVMWGVIGSGIGLALYSHPNILEAIKWVGAAYLAFLAWKIATAPAPGRTSMTGKNGTPLSFLQAAAFQWVNPKAWTMALTAIAIYLPAGSKWSDLLLSTLLVSVINLPCILVWTIAGVHLQRLLHQPGALRAFNIAAALLLIASLVPAFI